MFMKFISKNKQHVFVMTVKISRRKSHLHLIHTLRIRTKLRLM